MTIVVTGAAGFVGRAVCERLLSRGEEVVGVDDFNAYYDPALKEARAATLAAHRGFTMVRGDIADATLMRETVRIPGRTRIVHLAAQAGVRYSIENPFAYERSNLAGHLAMLEACRYAEGFQHMVYASSSSVYGQRPLGMSFSEDDPVDEPVSLYAATKRAAELMSTAYAPLYEMPLTGLRFFTVYGPWGRPDMAYFSFTKKILAGEPIEIYGEGQMARDFTYIDDIVDGVVGALDHPPDAGTNRIFNLGDNKPVGLLSMVSQLEEALGVEAQKVFKPMQPGDVRSTYAEIGKIAAVTGYAPKVMLAEGLTRFVEWYRGFYG